MSIRSFQYTFSAGETKTYIGGGYFTIEDLESDVTLEFFDSHGNSIGVVKNIGIGFWADFNTFANMASVKITSVEAQIINIVVGNEGQRFGVNKVTSHISGGQLTPRTLATHWGAEVGTTLITIVTPAANVNGVRIDYMGVLESVLTSVTNILSKDSAPTTYKDVLCRGLMNIHHDANDVLIKSVEFPIIIPAGEGIYSQSNTLAACVLNLEYEIL